MCARGQGEGAHPLASCARIAGDSEQYTGHHPLSPEWMRPAGVLHEATIERELP